MRAWRPAIRAHLSEAPGIAGDPARSKLRRGPCRKQRDQPPQFRGLLRKVAFGADDRLRVGGVGNQADVGEFRAAFDKNYVGGPNVAVNEPVLVRARALKIHFAHAEKVVPPPINENPLDAI